MKAYGYKKKDISKGLMEMREVSFVASADTLKELAAFFLATAEQLEKNRNNFDHIHASTTIKQWNEKWPDIILAKGGKS